MIAGNHDLIFDTENYPQLWRRFGHSEQFDSDPVKQRLLDAPGVIYLEDSGTDVNGIHIWGSPWLVGVAQTCKQNNDNVHSTSG